MAERAVVWTHTASRQLREVLKFWVSRNKSAAYSKKLLQKVQDQIEIIQHIPNGFPKTTYPKTRVAPNGHYSIFYQHNSKQITIVAFWDNRQNPTKLLKILQQSK